MKILYVITKSEIGGAQAHVLQLIEEAHSRNIPTHLVVGELGWLSEKAKEFTTVTHLPSLVREINPIKELLAVSGLVKIIKREKPNTVHAHSTKAGVIARLAAYMCKTPVIFTAHGWAFNNGSLFALKVEKLLAKITAKIICVSKTEAKLAIDNGFDSSKITVIYNGIEKNAKSLFTKPVPRQIIMVARFSEQKNHTALLIAMSLVSKSIKLVLVGTGPLLEDAKKLAKNLDLNVAFLGDRFDVLDLLAQSSAFVLSTHYEGLPISVIEAMRAGLPVIATDIPGMNELVTNNGLLVTGVRELADAINKLVFNSHWAEILGRNSRVNFEKHFTADIMLKKTFKEYEKTTNT